MTDKEKRPEVKQKGWLERFMEKMDKAMEKKAKNSCCCRGKGDQDKGPSCC